MTNFKKITDDIIESKVLDLIGINNETTTKEIKESLRADGYWVTQRDVHIYMENKFNSLGLSRVSNGVFFTYTKDDADLSTSLYTDLCSNKNDSSDDTTDSVTIDNTNSNVSNIPLSVNFTARQLRFTKDSNEELQSKLNNPKYTQFKSKIEAVLVKRNNTQKVSN